MLVGSQSGEKAPEIGAVLQPAAAANSRIVRKRVAWWDLTFSQDRHDSLLILPNPQPGFVIGPLGPSLKLPWLDSVDQLDVEVSASCFPWMGESPLYPFLGDTGMQVR
jgi:hypothetical protein